MIRRRLPLLLLVVIAVILGVAIAGVPNTGHSTPVRKVSGTTDTSLPFVDTLAVEGVGTPGTTTTVPATTKTR